MAKPIRAQDSMKDRLSAARQDLTCHVHCPTGLETQIEGECILRIVSAKSGARKAQPVRLQGRTPGCCPLWVRSGHSGRRSPMSALPPKADIAQDAATSA